MGVKEANEQNNVDWTDTVYSQWRQIAGYYDLDELASAVGTSRQTVSTFLNSWQKAEILTLNRKSFILRDI